MFPGLVTLCLNTHNLPEMRRFYEALGLQVHIDQPTNVLLNNGNVDIGLMTFLEAPCLNFRGADPFAMHKSMKDLCPTLEGTPAQYEKAQYAADADGASWMTYDPDGNGIFFDTNTLETGAGGAAFALQRVLDGAAKELANVGASDACRTAFRQEVQHRFMPPARYGGEEFNSAPGAHWQTKDPDGNVVYFDTTDPERIVPGDPTALQAVLQQTRQRLINISAEPTCIDAFETRIVQPFGG